MEEELTKEYSNGASTSVWKPKKCIHSEVCIKTLPEVYKPKESLDTKNRAFDRRRSTVKMKPHALLINTARGGIIDQEALLKALKNKKLVGFAADVLSEEPPTQNNPVVALENVLATAHLGSLTRTTYTRMCTMTVENPLAI